MNASLIPCRNSRTLVPASTTYTHQKRAIDLCVCMMALPVLLAATCVMVIHTSLTSPGPVFFRQKRIGLRGRSFDLYKFRTMHPRAETGSHRAHFAQLVHSGQSMQKLDGQGDARLIAGGWILRSSGIDELPQIINVLRGDMSIVGPRPCIPYEYEHYTEQQRQRFTTLPGLTGLWQVSGKNRTTFEEMIRLDLDYTRRVSLALDLKILAMTLPALCREVKDIYRSRAPRRAARVLKSLPAGAPPPAVKEPRPLPL